MGDQKSHCTAHRWLFFYEKRGLEVQNFITFPNLLWTFRKSKKIVFFHSDLGWSRRCGHIVPPQHLTYIQKPCTNRFNPDGAGFLNVAWVWGGTMCPHLLDHPKALQKTKNFLFDFLKVYYELGKVTKFRTSRPLFSWRKSHRKKVRADSAPPRPNRVKSWINRA